MLQPSEAESSLVVIEIVLSFDRTRDMEQKRAADEAESEVVGELRAVLDVERSASQQLTENVQQEHERVTQLNSELSQLREELTAERLLSASLKDDLNSAAVSQG